MTDRELMQQVLDALKVMRPACFANNTLKAADAAITALRERLAQASQEPVLWMMPDGNTADKWALQFYGGQKGKPLYTTPQPCPTCESLARTVMMDQTGYDPRQWVGLTDDEVERIKLDGRDLEFVSMTALHRFARDIQAKLKEKNNG